MEELIKGYFKAIKKPNLFGDKSIVFLLQGRLIPQNSKDLIKKYISDDNEVFIVSDLDDKIDSNLYSNK